MANKTGHLLSIGNVATISTLSLWIFGIGEVVCYNCGNTTIQYIFAFFAYILILVSFFLNPKNGLRIFICYNILALGIFNFWGKTDVISYWGIRVAGFSFNILFTAFMTIFTIFLRAKKDLFVRDRYTKFFFLFFVYGLIVGFILCLLGISYWDNYVNDILTFAPVFFYAILLKDFNLEDFIYIIKNTFTISVFSLIVAFLLNKQFEYASEWFLVCNTMSFLLPIGVFTLWQYYNKTQMIFFICIMFVSIILEAYFSCGKSFIMFAILILWTLAKSKHYRWFGFTLFFVLFPLLIIGLDGWAKSLNNKVLAFKITQIVEVYKSPQILNLASKYTSIGNLIAEGITLLRFYVENPHMVFTGGGLGAGIPDYYGFLTPWAGHAGYSRIDAVRNNFFNLHIAPYKVLANGGLILFVWYCKILYGLFVKYTGVAFLAFLMMFLMFYVSKEFLLLTLCLLRIVVLMPTNKNNETV